MAQGTSGTGSTPASGVGKPALAILEVLFVVTAYVLFTKFVIGRFDLPFQSYWALDPIAARVARGFTLGAVAQMMFIIVLALIVRSRSLREALASIFRPAPFIAWFIALSVAGFDIAVLYAGWIDASDVSREPLLFRASMAAVPALDGFTQEALFRGYLIVRLAGAGVNRLLQVLLSAAAFGAMHFGYGAGEGATWFDLVVPVLGTFGLGVGWAVAFQMGGHRLLPVIVAHMLIIVAVQPGLALSYLR